MNDFWGAISSFLRHKDGFLIEILLFPLCTKKSKVHFGVFLEGGGHVKSLKIMLFPTWAGVWGRVGALGGGFGALGEAPKSIIRDAKDYLGALN